MQLPSVLLIVSVEFFLEEIWLVCPCEQMLYEIKIVK
jgi:hypothetical protein